jgi:hypothetical protein
MNANNTHIRVYSLLCLSCHDGVGALNVLTYMPVDGGVILDSNPPALTAYGNDKIGDSPYTGSLNPNIGNRLTSDNTNYSGDNAVQLYNDHPISFDYNSDLTSADSGLKTPDNVQGYVTDTLVRLFPNPSFPSLRSSVECPTCHNVHLQGNETGGDPTFPFLVMSNAGSALCLKCHDK